MKYTKNVTVEAFQFTEKEIKTEKTGAEGKKDRKTFAGADVRGEGDAAFVNYSVSGKEFKLYPGQWVVTDDLGVSVWNDEDFKKTFTKSNQKDSPKSDAQKTITEPLPTSVAVATPTIQANKNAWTVEQINAEEVVTAEESVKAEATK